MRSRRHCLMDASLVKAKKFAASDKEPSAADANTIIFLALLQHGGHRSDLPPARRGRE
jgi:hypothetical protein